MSRLNIGLLGAGGQLGRTLIDDWENYSTPDRIWTLAGARASIPKVSETVTADLPQSRTAEDRHQQVCLYAFSRQQLDICSPQQLEDRLRPLDLQVIVNAAAYTQVDKAESEPEQAMHINGEGPARVAEFAARNGCRLIHLSTDFVFDGESSRAYRPDHPTSPCNHYGRTKLAGELAIADTCPDRAVIIRTSWLYSRYQPNFVTTMLRLMTERERLGIVSDQVGTPTSTHSLADLVARVIANKTASGVFHWSDAGVASWYDFAVAIQEEGLQSGLLKAAIPVDPITSSDYPTAAVRPAFSVLDKSASYQRFGAPPVHWRRELQRVVTELAQPGRWQVSL
ncbi:MAG: dTDP-4-dehydrorhamnose reductase [Gammaproteobacteria bacterium]|nr:dTDP-4-dehydrorhamnose reductase [Pseudomonadales bacterium]MCP5347820.1 dTDP-4-dehydrorhamnose reductase [Pseudomonadales bacterium]